jgi:hypothetical protein
MIVIASPKESIGSATAAELLRVDPCRTVDHSVVIAADDEGGIRHLDTPLSQKYAVSIRAPFRQRHGTRSSLR